jgi:hypothetical protein
LHYSQITQSKYYWPPEFEGLCSVKYASQNEEIMDAKEIGTMAKAYVCEMISFWLHNNSNIHQ